MNCTTTQERRIAHTASVASRQNALAQRNAVKIALFGLLNVSISIRARSGSYHTHGNGTRRIQAGNLRKIRQAVGRQFRNATTHGQRNDVSRSVHVLGDTALYEKSSAIL